MLAELDDRDRAYRAPEPIAKAADVDAEQRTEKDTNGRLVRNDQHLAVTMGAPNLFDHLGDALRERHRRFAIGRWIPRGIRAPAYVLVMMGGVDPCALSPSHAP